MKIPIRRMPYLFRSAALPLVGLSLLTLSRGYAWGLDSAAPPDGQPISAAGGAPVTLPEPAQAAE